MSVAMFDSNDFNNFIDKADCLYSLPDLCLQLNALVNDGKSSVDEVARLVSIDPALTARVLKLANSAIYFKRKSVTTISEAVANIGTDELNNIAIATSAAQIFRDGGGGKIDLHDYWYHSVVTAVVAKDIYYLSTGKRDGTLFVAGLLHNIGLLVVLERLPYFKVDLLQVIGASHLPWQYEKNELGFSFVEVSCALISRWNISDKLAAIIQHQYAPVRAPSYKIETLVLNSAIVVADHILKQSAPANCEEYLELTVGKQLALDYQQLDEVISNARKAAPAVAKIFNG